MVFINFFIFRFLLKSLLQYQSLSEGELLPTPSSSAHLPLPPVALSSGPSGASGLSTTHSVSSTVPTGEEGALKKPKKERRERGRENGKDERECYDQIFIKTENDILVLLYTTKLCWNWAFSSKEDVQEEKTRRWLAEGGASHPSRLFWPSCLSHSTGRFDSLQSGRGRCLSDSKPLSWGFKVPIFSIKWALEDTIKPLEMLTLMTESFLSALQIITDRMLFHDECAIYPVGFCSTRIFASMKNPEQQCLYTCQIKDGGTGPQVSSHLACKFWYMFI